MKNQTKKWFRWGAAGLFGLMLTLNVMVGLDFKKDKVLPTLTLMELGNLANAQSESGGSGGCYQAMRRCNGTMTAYTCISDRTSSSCSSYYCKSC